MQWLNYHHLYYFYTIATEGSITKATTKLRLAQSTLSAQLKQFEGSIGYELFERKNKKLYLTDVGRKVLDYAHEIFSIGSELRDSLGSFDNPKQLSLRIGIMDSIPKKLARDLVEIAVKDNHAKITVAEESLGSLLNRLADHSIDLILANDKPPTEGRKSQFYAKLVGELKVVIVGSPESIKLKNAFPRSLNNQPMIMPSERSPLRNEIIEHFKIKHIQPRIVAQVDDLELQKMLVLDGIGFTAMPLMAVEKELKEGKLIRLSDTPVCHENLWLIAAHRLIHNPIAKKLLATFRP